MNTQEIDNTLNVIDSRDIVERLEFLESEYSDFIENGEEEDFDYIEELESLRSIIEDWSGVSDWEYGAFFVRDDYWEEYAEDLVREIGDLPRDFPQYIESHIDWGGVAEDIKQDYSPYVFDGVTYWCRY